MIDVSGRPLAEAEKLLETAGIKYNITYSRPDSCFFSLAEGNAYVIRQNETADGKVMLIIADKLRKEVS